MTNTAIKTTILQILQEIRPETDFRQADNYIENGLLDSFDIINLVTLLDERFRFSIEGTEITPDNFQSIETMENLVEKALGRIS